MRGCGGVCGAGGGVMGHVVRGVVGYGVWCVGVPVARRRVWIEVRGWGQLGFPCST